MSYEERIRSLSDMFMESLEQLELSRTLAQMNTEDLAKYRIQYIGEIIKANIYNEKEKYILRLLQQVQQLKKGNVNDKIVQIQMRHQKQIEALKKQLGQREPKPQSVDSELRGLIQQKMQELQKDYILKVIHQQEMKDLERRLTGGKQYHYQGVIEQLKLQNQMIKNQIQARYGKTESKFVEIERSPVQQLDQIYTTMLSPAIKMPALQIQSIKEIPFELMNQMEPQISMPPSSTLKRSKSIQTFNELKDNFQKQLIQLKQTVHAKHNKIVKSRQKLQLSRETNLRPCIAQAPLQIQERFKTNRANAPHLDYYTFARRCDVGSPTIKKATRGSQRVLNARKPNTPQQRDILNYRYI